jgi:hypothetical protein
MNSYTLRIRRHYSGLFVGQCAEDPSLTVMGRDHEEVTLLAAQAVADRRTVPPRPVRLAEHGRPRLD